MPDNNDDVHRTVVLLDYRVGELEAAVSANSLNIQEKIAAVREALARVEALIEARTPMDPNTPNPTGWHDNAERSWVATIRENPVKVFISAVSLVMVLLAFSVTLAVCNSPDPLGTLTNRQVEAQEKSANAQDRSADALEDLVDDAEGIPTESP